jgi:hypothetical protein
MRALRDWFLRWLMGHILWGSKSEYAALVRDDFLDGVGLLDFDEADESVCEVGD